MTVKICTLQKIPYSYATIPSFLPSDPLNFCHLSGFRNILMSASNNRACTNTGRYEPTLIIWSCQVPAHQSRAQQATASLRLNSYTIPDSKQLMLIYAKFNRECTQFGCRDPRHTFLVHCGSRGARSTAVNLVAKRQFSLDMGYLILRSH